MTYACPDCRLRFTRATAAYLEACPECGKPPQAMASLASMVGFRLFEPQDLPPSLPEAIASMLPTWDPDEHRR